MTIKDIARLAGVSHSTVSRSLNDNPLIPPETRERIKAIAREQGYEVNAIARSLSRGKTSTVALIYPEYFERRSINVFFGNLLSLVRQVFEREMIDTIVAFPKNLHSGASSIRRLAKERKVDGMIIVNNEIDDEDLACLSDRGIPFVFLHKRPLGRALTSIDYVCSDHEAGGRLAGERLVSLGRRRLLCVAAIGEEFDARSSGFSRALADSGLDPADARSVYGDCSFEYGAGPAADQVLGSGRYDGVFCQTDLMALGLIQSLLRAGRRVPEDVAVVGYDDIEMGAYFIPSLTTIHQPLEEIATAACERLIEILSGRGEAAALQLLLPPSLVVRNS